jgi:5-bromo-4-chloroindolyl phosphate hydrolysis protein
MTTDDTIELLITFIAAVLMAIALMLVILSIVVAVVSFKNTYRACAMTTLKEGWTNERYGKKDHRVWKKYKYCQKYVDEISTR